jgi:hypothetical protein
LAIQFNISCIQPANVTTDDPPEQAPFVEAGNKDISDEMAHGFAAAAVRKCAALIA